MISANGFKSILRLENNLSPKTVVLKQSHYFGVNLLRLGFFGHMYFMYIWYDMRARRETSYLIVNKQNTHKHEQKPCRHTPQSDTASSRHIYQYNRILSDSPCYWLSIEPLVGTVSAIFAPQLWSSIDHVGSGSDFVSVFY